MNSRKIDIARINVILVFLLVFSGIAWLCDIVGKNVEEYHVSKAKTGVEKYEHAKNVHTRSSSSNENGINQNPDKAGHSFNTDKKFDAGENTSSNLNEYAFEENGSLSNLISMIDSAIDNDDFEALKPVIHQIYMHRNPEVRLHLAGELRNFGTKAIPELVMFFNDPDENVEEIALNSFDSILDDCDDEEKASVVSALMKSTAIQDDEQMEIIGMHLNTMQDESASISAIVDIMENGQSEIGKKWAADSYEFITGEKFSSRNEAAKWIAENCENEQ